MKKQKYELRPYQKEASDIAVDFFLDDSRDYNALIVASTGCGKSLIISDIAYRLNANVLVFCPNKEITEQNYEKMCSYGVDCSMYSASVGQKVISKITFAMIGSAVNNIDKFKSFDYIIIDEAHTVSPVQGMYKEALKKLKKKVLGLTATPYRLETDVDYDYYTKTINSSKSYLKMLTGYKKPIFEDIIYNIETKYLIENGYLANLKYFDLRPYGWNQDKLFKNTSGSDYSDKSVRWMQEKVGFFDHLVNVVKRLLHPKDGKQRNGILVFVRFKEDSQKLCEALGSLCVEVNGETPKKKRSAILEAFKSGKIKVITNVGVLTTGFDYPALDTIVLARATMSLSLYYQCVGRALRIDKNKQDAWIVDMVGNFQKFGAVSDLHVSEEDGEWNIYSGYKKLTNTYL